MFNNSNELIMSKRLFSLALCLLIGLGTAFAQTVKVSGTVTDNNGDPVVSAAVQLGADPEETLHAACEKFIRRFGAMEHAAQDAGRELSQLTREELLTLWRAQKPQSESHAQ
mgnify:CR=1 FL=1